MTNHKIHRLGALTLSVILSAAFCLGTACSREKTAEQTAFTAENPGEMTSQEVVSDMKIGWNLGNTLDVCAADRDGDGTINEAPAEGESVTETLWGNPKATPDLFEHLKEDGINAVRIPITWRDHLTDEAGTIDPEWMNRVQEVVDYAYSLDMYVIINLHHDGGGDPNFGAWIRTDTAGFPTVEARYQYIWEQICEQFAAYDAHLIFESMNEVGFDQVSQGEAYSMLNLLNQEFVDVVRSSGGENATRHLLIAGYWTDIASTCNSKYILPNDPAERCILSVHYYTPYQFCITDEAATWGSDAEIAEMEHLIQQITNSFVIRGVPVIVGEYGCNISRDAESRVLFCKTLTKLCREQGIATFFWDNGEEYDRTNFTWRTDGLIEALQEATTS